MTQSLEQELKSLVIDALGLEDITPDDIENTAPLFGDGLGLDSVDALELGLALQKRYKITIDPETRNMRDHFSSIANLAAFIRNQQAA
ncbi:acyl carrier protein [Cephaloticoccus primus]|uniref:Acyl carrier protein n=1 Tax=Cephaloticoccus primus TaxID=1548207 RepID=A0A139SQS9_9BACT|nr:phosphopantetheine-binding protein [Cephaloticoccus primus]KXU36864.1 acyl carrier protein [Cephaloticoccus primus]